MSIPIIGTWALKKECFSQQLQVRRKRKGRTEQGILIWCCDDLELLRTTVIPQPSPPTTLNTGRGSVKLFLERIHRTKVPLQCGSQLAVVFELTAALVRRREVLPEQRVIYVALEVGFRSTWLLVHEKL